MKVIGGSKCNIIKNAITKWNAIMCQDWEKYSNFILQSEIIEKVNSKHDVQELIIEVN